MVRLRDQIDQGVLKPGDPLPTREKLMKEHELSLSTVTRAISELERQGWLISRQGSGTFVARANGQQTPAPQDNAVVGLLLPHNYPGAQELVSELVHEGEQNNIEFITMFAPSEQEKELNQGRLLLERGVQAMVWFPVAPKRHVSVASLFGKNQLPVVFGERVSEQFPAPWRCVHSDHYNGTQKAIEHLLELGHRRIAYIGPRGGECDFGPIPERWAAYKEKMKEINMWDPDTLVFHPSMLRDWQENRHRVETIFRGDHAPTAIIGFDDATVLEAIKQLRTLNLNNVEEIAVVGHGDTPYSHYCHPRLSTVSPAYSEFVDLIIRSLIKELRGEEDGERLVAAPQRLILRESTLTPEGMVSSER